MKRLEIQETWPDSWKYSYPYDLQEIWGVPTHKGYTYAYHNRRRMALDLLMQVLPKGATVLDVAAAQGNFSLFLAEYGYVVTWNDLREDLSDYVKRKYEYGELNFEPGNIYDLPFHEEFDCVFITEIIEHVAHPDEFLSKVAHMVKPGGYVVMSTPNGAYFRNDLPKFSECSDPSQFESVQFAPNADGHVFLLWPEEVKLLAEKTGLKMEKHLMFTNPLTAGHLKTELLLKFIPGKLVWILERLTQFLPSFINKRLSVHSATRFRKPLK